jgi:hypothetical protein
LRDDGKSALQWRTTLPLCERRAQGQGESCESRERDALHGVTVRVTLPDLPPLVAVMVAVWVDETLLPVTVAVAALVGPVDVVLLAGEIVAAPDADHVTERPWRRFPAASVSTAVAVVVGNFLMVAV